ncbi:MAG: 50S ribosomal protein L15 [bacterium]
MITLSNLKKSNNKKRKRVGRGNASGHGTYSTRGIKGQKARSGRKNLKIKGFKQILSSIPKNRGFKSVQSKPQVINIEDINKNYKDGETVNIDSLCLNKLIDDKKQKVKILGKGELKIKGLKIEGCELSETVKKQFQKMN